MNEKTKTKPVPPKPRKKPGKVRDVLYDYITCMEDSMERFPNIPQELKDLHHAVVTSAWEHFYSLTGHVHKKGQDISL